MDFTSLTNSTLNQKVVSTNDVVLAKASAIGILFLAALACGFLPFGPTEWLKWRLPTRAQSIIAVQLQFGGGVLLATTFLKILPNIRINIVELQATQHLVDTNFPLAEFLVFVGFFFIFFVWELIANWRHSEDFENIDCHLKKSLEAMSEKPNHHHSDQTETVTTKPGTFSPIMRSMLLVMAVSVHELFSGMALGMQDTSADVWKNFKIIIGHRMLLAFCIGAEIIVATMVGGRRNLAVCLVLLFAVITSIGIGLGMLSGVRSSGFLMAELVVQAMAAGTLVFVVFFKILSGRGRGQCAAVFVGFFAMQLIVGHHENIPLAYDV